MDAIKLASLRKEFSALLKQHDGSTFRFIVEMLFHCEILDKEDYDPIVWDAANKAIGILIAVNADFDEVYAWGLRGPGNGRRLRTEMFIENATI